jgi:hypothetical protein
MSLRNNLLRRYKPPQIAEDAKGGRCWRNMPQIQFSKKYKLFNYPLEIKILDALWRTKINNVHNNFFKSRKYKRGGEGGATVVADEFQLPLAVYVTEFGLCGNYTLRFNVTAFSLDL